MRAAVEYSQVQVQLIGEVVHYVAHDVRLGRSGETQDRRNRLVIRSLPNVASYIPVVGPEVMPPLRETVRLVQHPVADLTLFEHPPDGYAAQLLGRYDQHARITEAHLVQRIASFGHR